MLYLFPPLYFSGLSLKFSNMCKLVCPKNIWQRSVTRLQNLELAASLLQLINTNVIWRRHTDLPSTSLAPHIAQN